MNRADTRELQIRIAGWAAGSPRKAYLSIDGVFGPKTKAALRRFQDAYLLTVDGIVGPQTAYALNALEQPDGSTQHFQWANFVSHDGACFTGGHVRPARVRENVRRQMHKLEALRKKLDDHPMRVLSGFRSIPHNAAEAGAKDSQHTYGRAVDIHVPAHSAFDVALLAKTCGFKGIKPYGSTSYIHLDDDPDRWWWSPT